MNSNKKKAALLWKLLPLKERKQIASFLLVKEIQELESIYFHEYSKLSKSEKTQIQYELYRMLSFSYHYFQIVAIFFFFLFVLLFFYYIFQYPKTSPLFLFELFSPLALGVFSFWLLITIPRYEFRLLFRFPRNIYMYIYSILIFYLILFLLFMLNQNNQKYTALYPVEMLILLLGVGLAPLSEEIIFRYHIPNQFGRGVWQIWIGHLIANIGFSFAHLPYHIQEGVLFFLSGMSLSFLRITTNTLIVPILVHSFANLVVFLIYHL